LNTQTDIGVGSCTCKATLAPNYSFVLLVLQHSSALISDSVVWLQGREGMPDLRDNLAPLWKLPYSEQLMRKQATCVEALDRLTWELGRCLQDKPAWLASAMLGGAGKSPCCTVEVRALASFPH
jgi:hypothetical protein